MIIKIKIIFRTEKFQPEILEDIISNKNDLIKINRFGYTEPLKNKIDTNRLDQVSSLFKEYMAIILKGEKKFWLSGSAIREGLLPFSGEIDLKKEELTKIDSILEFMELFSSNGQLLYGYVCAEDEFDEKHKVVGNASYGWEGVSKWDYFEFSPGLHWYTIIGKDLADAIGREKISSLEGVEYRTVEDNSIAFHLKEPIQSENMEKRTFDLEKLEEQIGANYFFSKNRDKSMLSHPIPYKDFLSKLGPGI